MAGEVGGKVGLPAARTTWLARALGAMAVCAAVAVAPAVAPAQEDYSLAGATRATVSLSHRLGSDPVTRVAVTVAPFLTERWQVVVSPAYTRRLITGQVSQSSTTSLAGNYVAGRGRLRPYAGVLVAALNGTNRTGETMHGVHAGALLFASPTVGARGELRLRAGSRNAGWRTTAGLHLEPYFRAATSAGALGTFGVADVALDAAIDVAPGGFATYTARVAPFVTRWLQVGVQRDESIVSAGDGAAATRELVRLYLPLDVLPPIPAGALRRTALFAGAYAEQTTFSDAATGGYELGVRYMVAPRVAADTYLERRRLGGPNPYTVTTLRAGFVTQLGRARRERATGS